MAPLLETRGAGRTLSGTEVLKDVSLEFGPATITAVCGPNGAGKSTLLRILALLDHPDAGEIWHKGKRLAQRGDWFAARRSITMVGQDPFAFRGSVFVNVAYGLHVRGASADKTAARAAECLAAVGLAGFEKRRARTLSGGETQRMALARAIALSTEVLVLDEPTAHVDRGFVSAVENLIRKQRDENGAAVIVATHDQGQACRLADRVVEIEGGRVGGLPSRVVAARLVRAGGGEKGRDMGAGQRPRAALVVRIESGDAPGGGMAFGDQEDTASTTTAIIQSMESAGDAALLRFDNGLPLVRAPLADLENARPVPGETVTIRGLLPGPDSKPPSSRSK